MLNRLWEGVGVSPVNMRMLSAYFESEQTSLSHSGTIECCHRFQGPKVHSHSWSRHLYCARPRLKSKVTLEEEEAASVQSYNSNGLEVAVTRGYYSPYATSLADSE